MHFLNLVALVPAFVGLANCAPQAAVPPATPPTCTNSPCLLVLKDYAIKSPSSVAYCKAILNYPTTLKATTITRFTVTTSTTSTTTSSLINTVRPVIQPFPANKRQTLPWQDYCTVAEIYDACRCLLQSRQEVLTVLSIVSTRTTTFTATTSATITSVAAVATVAGGSCSTRYVGPNQYLGASYIPDNTIVLPVYGYDEPSACCGLCQTYGNCVASVSGITSDEVQLMAGKIQAVAPVEDTNLPPPQCLLLIIEKTLLGQKAYNCARGFQNFLFGAVDNTNGRFYQGPCGYQVLT